MSEEFNLNPTRPTFRRSRFFRPVGFVSTAGAGNLGGNAPPQQPQTEPLARPTIPLGEGDEFRLPRSNLANLTQAPDFSSGRDDNEPFGAPGDTTAAAREETPEPTTTAGRVARALNKDLVNIGPFGVSTMDVIGKVTGVPGRLTTPLSLAVESNFSKLTPRQEMRLLGSVVGAPLNALNDFFSTPTMQGLRSDEALQGPRPDIGHPDVQRGLERDAAISDVAGGAFSSNRGAVRSATHRGTQFGSTERADEAKDTPGAPGVGISADDPSTLGGHEAATGGGFGGAPGPGSTAPGGFGPSDREGHGGFGDGGDGGQGSGNNSGSDATGGTESGRAHGGVVRPNDLRGPDPRGPDTGYVGIQAGEGVLTREAMGDLGPQNLRVLNTQPQARMAVVRALEPYKQPKSRLAHVNTR